MTQGKTGRAWCDPRPGLGHCQDAIMYSMARKSREGLVCSRPGPGLETEHHYGAWEGL